MNTEYKIKKFKGFSGSEVYLIRTSSSEFVRKEFNTQRNFDKMTALHDAGFLVPKIIRYGHDVLDMEYISGCDMRTFFKTHDPELLLQFIINVVDKFRTTSKLKDYTDTYVDQLNWITGNELPFSVDELIERVPKKLESSLCHGDFTMENLIFNGTFYMIDPVTGPYDSWIFDLAKLRQDLDGKWFMRYDNSTTIHDNTCKSINDSLREMYPDAFDDSLYILMLLRVYKYAKEGTMEKTFILREIERVWKS